MTSLDASITLGLSALRCLGSEYDDLCMRLDAPITTRPVWLTAWAETHPGVSARHSTCARWRGTGRCGRCSRVRRAFGWEVVVSAGLRLSDRYWMLAVDEDSADQFLLRRSPAS